MDGHHNAFAKRAISIPDLFNPFTKYNTPELSKHRKRRTANLSSDQLQNFALSLSSILNQNYWDRPHWNIDLKPSVLQLCESLTSYVKYLADKNKRIKENHRSPTPIRELGSNLKLKFIASNGTSTSILPPQLQAIDELLIEKPVYTYVFLHDHLPHDPVTRHRLLDRLISTGLSYPCILLIYSPGSNVGNLQFLWKVPGNDNPAEYFEHSQVLVEEVKKCIPVYHTRYMRAVMYQKFGRISPQVKPSILRYFYRDLTG